MTLDRQIAVESIEHLLDGDERALALGVKVAEARGEIDLAGDGQGRVAVDREPTRLVLAGRLGGRLRFDGSVAATKQKGQRSSQVRMCRAQLGQGQSITRCYAKRARHFLDLRKAGERGLEIAGYDGRYYVRIPFPYDPSTRYPLGFAFHGSNRNHFNCHEGDCYGFQSELGQHAVLVYMQSLRTPPDAEEGGWNDALDDNVAFFEAVLEAMKSDFCIDETRVFVAGTSSGAIFSNVLACRLGDRLLAAAPVAGSLPESDCKGTPAILAIHGVDDPHVPFADGEAARDFFAARSGCSASTEPPLETVHAEIRAKRDADPSVEATACADYQDCTAAPVRWCEHSYGGYDGSTHGWPPDGGQLIWDFIQSLD